MNFGMTEEERPALYAEGGKIYNAIKKLETFLDKVSGKYAVGDEMTMADFVLYSYCGGCIQVVSMFFAPGVPLPVHQFFPFVLKFRDAVVNNANVQTYFETMKDNQAYDLGLYFKTAEEVQAAIAEAA